jgi:hypothetical protein
MMKFNTSPEFAGLKALKAAHARQIELFEAWAAAKEWAAFHSNHYDWWTFPIDQPSAYGFKWVVYEGDIARLIEDAEFMQTYRRGLELLAASWGWDLQAQGCISDPLPTQPGTTGRSASTKPSIPLGGLANRMHLSFMRNILGIF